MRKSLALGFTMLVAAAAVGCTGTVDLIVGSGTAASEDRTVAAFTEVAAGQAITVTVTIGTPQAVRVTADDNLISRVRTDVSGNRLTIGLQGMVTARTPITVAIIVPSLTSITADSAARVTASGLDEPALMVSADSAGIVNASGQATSVSLSILSGAVADLSQLAAGPVQATIDSAGRATVNSNGAVTGSVTAAGLLTIQGSPTSVNVSTDSAGQVIQP